MKSLLLPAAAIFALTLLISGCGTDSQTKVSPKTMPDPVLTDRDQADMDAYGDMEHVSSYEQDAPMELMTVHFEYDRYDLTPEEMEVLTRNAEMLARHPNAVIRIEGHCDERGTEEYNMALGEKRARTVKQYLSNFGVNPDNLSIISYGEMVPVDYGKSESAWRKNRRAELVVRSE